MSARQTSADENGWKRGEKGFARSAGDEIFAAQKGSRDKAAAKRQFGPTGGGDLLAIDQRVGSGKKFSGGPRW